MDNSKVLKPIIGPQESEASKKKEGNKKKKALIVSALAFLIATGTIATSIAVVKANMPKLEIKFDQWFVDAFDKDSIQRFIDENRLSEQSMFKRLPGYVDRKAKDQNVKNSDAIADAKFTDKVPNDKSNKFPPGVYIEMIAEDEYSFKYQADLSLEDNNQETKELSKLTKEEEKKTPYFITKDGSKLYILVYERPLDNDITNEVEDLQTFNDYGITNVGPAFEAINNYIYQKPRRYTKNEFASQFKDQDGNEIPQPELLEIFYKQLIGLERKYVLSSPAPIYDIDSDTVTIYLNNTRSNFEFIVPDNYQSNVKYDADTGTLTLSGFKFHNLSQIKLDTLHQDIQEFIKLQANRYTLEEFTDQMGNEDLRKLILNSVDPEKKDPTLPKPFDETVTDPDVPEGGDGTEEVPPPEEKPEPGKPKIKNMFMRSGNLVIAFECDEGYKYQDIYVDENNRDDTKYSFDTQNDELTVKNLKYFTEYTVTNTAQAFNNLDKKIVEIANQYTVAEFTAFVGGQDTQDECKQLIASALRTNKGAFNQDWITGLEVIPHETSQINATLKIQFDTDFKKYKTNETEQFAIDSENSTLEIPLTFFKEVQMNDLKQEIQLVIDADPGVRYTVDEFETEINSSTPNTLNDLQNKIKEIVESKIQGATNVEQFNYDKEENKLTFNVTIPKYDKFPASGPDIEYEFLSKDEVGTSKYKVTVSNLQYWFDFKIANDTLIQTKQKVEEYITNNAVSASDDPDENTYPEHKDAIYQIFGEATLENGRKLSEFMTNDNNNFKLINHSNFNINLKPKLDLETRMRRFYQVDGLTGDGIELKESDKMLKFNNLEFSIGDKYFVVNRKDKIIYGVSDLGLKSKVLTTPKGYMKIKPTLGDVNVGNNKIEKSWSFNDLNNLQVFNMNNDVTEIKADRTGISFMRNLPNLFKLNLSSNIKILQQDHSFWGLPKLKDFNFKKGFNILTELYNFYFETSIDRFLLPRNLKTLYTSNFSRSNPDLAPNGESYFIGWCDLIYGETAFYNQKYIKAICLLTKSWKQNGDYKPFYYLLQQNKDVKFYVVNSSVKNTLIKSGVPSDRFDVRSNLEQELIAAGKIPSDW